MSGINQFVTKSTGKDIWAWMRWSWGKTKSGGSWLGNMAWILGTATLFISIPLQFANDREKFALYYMLAVAFFGDVSVKIQKVQLVHERVGDNRSKD